MTKEQIAARVRSEMIIDKVAPADSMLHIGMSGADEYNEITNYLCDRVFDAFVKSNPNVSMVGTLVDFVKSGEISRSYIGLLLFAMLSRVIMAESELRGIRNAQETIKMMRESLGVMEDPKEPQK